LPGLLECSSCGFISADVSISDEELRTLYGEDYFHGKEYLDYIAEEESLRLNFRDRVSELKKLVPNWSSADLFEVGCAYGFFLSEMKAQVRSASGIDIAGEAVSYGVRELGVDARQGDYLTFYLPAKVDVITMWDTIEHLRRPDLFVAKAASDLRPGGILAVTTGDVGSLNARMRGRHWRMIHPPTHLHYFSVSTMKKLFEANGLEIVHVSHPGISRRLRSMLYFIFVLKVQRPQIYHRLKSLPIFNFRLRMNLFDVMYVVGRLKA
jgi:SAM-dependent methyltransferase